MSARATSVVLAVASLLLVAGCAGDEPAPTPTPTVTAPAEPSPEPSPSPDPTPSGDFDMVSFRGASIEAPDFETFSAELGSPVAGYDECPWYALVEEHGADATTHAFTDPREVDPGIRFFYTMGLGTEGAVEFPRTAEGVGVGSTEAEVLAAYPDAVSGTASDVGAGDFAVVTVEDAASGSKYVFGFNGGTDRVDLLQWGPDAGNQWSHLCTGL